MALLKPFAALRPKSALADRICELPYDVMSTAEARAMAAGNDLSFLHVSKPEIDLGEDQNPYAPEVYARGAENFKRLIDSGALVRDARPAFYLYRQTMGSHSQLGLVAGASCSEYERQLIKKHELTRPVKEEDRVRHIEALQAQTGPVFLTYRAVGAVETRLASLAERVPEVEVRASDGVIHQTWTVERPEDQEWIQKAFADVPALYIADGHHRSAAAHRVFAARHGAGGSGVFLAVIFPHSQMQILAYNRVLKDLNGLTAADLLQRLDGVFVISDKPAPEPGRKHQMSLYLQGRWRTLDFRPHFAASKDPRETLDVSLLQQLVLGPVFGIEDPRTSERIAFVGGIRGHAELERMVDRGDYACALSMYPTSLEDLMAISDQGGIMPPKSTWFEPKLRDGLFSHMI